MPLSHKNPTPRSQNRFRLAAMGLGLALGLLVVVVGVKWYHAGQSPKFLGNYKVDGFNPHPYLGYAPAPNTTITSCKVLDVDTLYCAQYTVDAQGRRLLPERFVAPYHFMLFGCSVTYGEGVNDNETFAHLLADAAPQYRVYNYAYSGYGPQHMLAQWQWGQIPLEVPETQGAMLYVLLPEHVHRAAGAPYFVQGWGSSSPHYAFGGDTLKYYPDHTAWRPVYTTWHRLLGWSGLGGLFGGTETNFTPQDVALTVAIISEAQERYLAAYPSGQFKVVIAPFVGHDALYNALLQALSSENIGIVDASKAYPQEPPYTILHDGHPTALGHQAIFELLARELL